MYGTAAVSTITYDTTMIVLMRSREKVSRMWRKRVRERIKRCGKVEAMGRICM
jgi:hypothetical protein